MNSRERRNKRRDYCSNVIPEEVYGLLNLRAVFYRDELHSIIKGLFKVKCPIEWHKDYILNTLVERGFIIIADTPVGIIPCHGSLSGINYWGYPTEATIDLPTIGSFTRDIGKDCEVVFLERTKINLFYTFYRLIDLYAYKLASCDAGIDMNIFNSRLAYMIEAESKAQSETIKKMYDDVTQGKPLVVYKANGIDAKGLNMFFNNLKQNFIAPEIQDVKRSIINEFLTRLGINNANTDKKERLVTNEVDANNVELRCNVHMWKENLKTSTKRVKKLFPDTKFKIKLEYDAKELDKKVSSTVELGRGDSSNDFDGSNRNVENPS